MTVMCLNCPLKPQFPDMDAFKEHWRNTHTVPHHETLDLPANLKQFFPEVQAKTVKWYEEVA